jgi:ubiquinone/menaquinone biosynthesis C-methylase UbiE
VLEVGCGPGALARRLADEHAIAVTAIDISERMVQLARPRGIDAAVCDVQSLPFPDESFDCAIAAWMLYHRLTSIRGFGRSLGCCGPGGRLAVTNSERHLVELWQLVGRDRYEFPFNVYERSRESSSGISTMSSRAMLRGP